MDWGTLIDGWRTSERARGMSPETIRTRSSWLRLFAAKHAAGRRHGRGSGRDGGGGMTSRPAKPGELCTCGRPAIIVYVTERFGDVGYCGIPDGGQR